MSNNKQSSVDFLINLLTEKGYAGVLSEDGVEQAKAMHEAEMVQFALFFSHAQVSRTNVTDEYNETFGGSR